MEKGAKPLKFVFVLVPEYSSLSLFSALETLRVANRGQNTPLFDWEILSEKGETIKSSLGFELLADSELYDVDRGSIILVCSGENVQKNCTPKLLSWLRHQRRRGIEMGGLCTAAYILAKAGLLGSYKATIHWENRHGFQESFPSAELSDQVFVAEGGIYSTAGGTASIDLILTLITKKYEQDLSSVVSGRLMYSRIHDVQRNTRLSASHRVGIQNKKIAEVLDLMEAHLEEPLSPQSLAEKVHVSVRQLERLFKSDLGCPPMKFYRQLRLERAQDLLLQSNLSVTEVTTACGFSSNTHFAKLYRDRFGVSPTMARKK